MPIRIIARQANFRRCGIAHSVTPTEYPDDHFTEAELIELRAEPKLVVHIVKAAEPALNSADTIALVKTSGFAELVKMAEGETRKTVLAAMAARRKELESAE